MTACGLRRGEPDWVGCGFGRGAPLVEARLRGWGADLGGVHLLVLSRIARLLGWRLLGWRAYQRGARAMAVVRLLGPLLGRLVRLVATSFCITFVSRFRFLKQN